MMNLLSANLQAFQAVAQVGTVHGAARQLHLTQTGVTQRIRAIERQLGTTLFLRSRQGMRLTTEGEALLRYCRGAEELESQILGQLIDGGRSDPVHVTVVGPTSVLTARTVPACMQLYREWPQLYLHFIVSDIAQRLDLVRSGIAALAIVPPQLVPNEMDSKVLKKDRYLLVACPQWTGRHLSELLEKERIIDFAADDPTTTNYLRQFGLESSVKRPRLFINNNDAIIQMFAAGIGFGTLTQDVAAPHLQAGRLIPLNRGAVMEESLALAWFPRPQMPSYFRAIINAIC